MSIVLNKRHIVLRGRRSGYSSQNCKEEFFFSTITNLMSLGNDTGVQVFL